MTETSMTGRRLLRRWRSLRIIGLLFFFILLSSITGSASAAESGATSQCLACHTDAAKLQALTPPDPPAPEAGEG